MRDLTIGVLARRTGVRIETIRYYERSRLLPAPPRTAGGHRLYDDRHVKRLTFVRRSRALGFSLDEIRTLLRLVDRGAPCGEVQAVAQGHLGRIRAKIADLERMERMLADSAARCRGDAARRCPIVDDLLDAA